MKMKSWLVLAMFLAGCPLIEVPSADGGVDGEGSDNADCAEGDDCDGPAMNLLPGAAGSGSNERSDDGSATIGFDAGMGEHETDPSRPGADGAAGSFQAALDDFYTTLCGCNGLSLDECTSTTAEERACDEANVEAHADAAGPWLECVAAYLREHDECERNAQCEIDALADCAVVAQSGDEDPFTAACGAPPASLDEGAEGCSDTQSMFPCLSGGEVPGDAICDGAQDCRDGSDENQSLCGGSGETFACGDGESIPQAWVCDFEADCASGSDEVGCDTFDCGDGSFIPSTWVCDTEADCLDGSDEQECSSSF
ncbi:MAG: hypothetical protein EHM50_10400 [Lysobacterales bacterium]|nr:MAG: hypothetical protein EHM50_10400 [Xanthomonadales bacterium]